MSLVLAAISSFVPDSYMHWYLIAPIEVMFSWLLRVGERTQTTHRPAGTVIDFIFLDELGCGDRKQS